ncbi:hypothetical protein [Paenibacillus xylanexedens]|uniref:hypothetical protein n=1 Tax=Paenibacillus xylanexedens TaxID=528191 RepID=UPI0011A2D2FC|nr:hypothetical protein [Paenibacillus xylanexedens]
MVITDEAGHFPAIQFNVVIDGKLLSSITIMWARFRELPDQPHLFEVRSCDCGGVVCGHPTQRMYLDKSLLGEWTLKSSETIKYVFVHEITSL